MSDLREVGHCQVATPRTARKQHICEGCYRLIQPGDRYIDHVAFPGHDSGICDEAGVPLRFPECAWCAERYGRDWLL